jgi:TatD DNase family protein
MSEIARAERAFDSHTHLNHPRLLRKLAQVLSRAQAAGVREMIVVGYDVASSRVAVSLAQEQQGLWATVGVHPHDAASVDEATLDELRTLARSPRVVAIGETGLDFYRDLSPRDAQEQSFGSHLALAAELNLPAVLHCRSAQDRFLAVLRERSDASAPLIWHSFDGSLEQAQQAMALGAVLGFNGSITYPRSEQMRQVAAALPIERVLLETDCPYLPPEPRRKGDNEPANLPLISRQLGDARGVGTDDVLRATTANARRVFRLPNN